LRVVSGKNLPRKGGVHEIWSLTPASPEIWLLKIEYRDPMTELRHEREPVTKFRRRTHTNPN
jgi:hypothetical protein